MTVASIDSKSSFLSRGHLFVKVTLDIVPLNQIVPHEESPSWYAGPVLDHIERDGYLGNPIICAPIEPGVFGTLDGTNRTLSVKELGCEFVAIQVVDLADPTSVRMGSWSHFIEEGNSSNLLQEVGRAGLSVNTVPAEVALAELTAGRAIAAFSDAVAEGETTRMTSRTSTLVAGSGAWHEQLNAVANLYGEHIRVACESGAPFHLQQRVNEQTAGVLVSFAPVAAGAIRDLVLHRASIHAGISKTRLVGGRALGVRVPLALLRPGTPVEKHEAFLHQLMCEAPIRFYPTGGIATEGEDRRRYDEPLIIFDPDMQVKCA